MPKCNDVACSCIVRGSPGVNILGAGSAQSPYIVTIDQSARISVLDTPTVDLNLKGTGTTQDPAELTASLTAHLGDLIDVAKGTPVSGQVLAWTGAQWAPVPPATAAPGAIAVGTGMSGDGSSGAPLRPVTDPGGGLAVGTLGIGLSAATQARLTTLETIPQPQYMRTERTDVMTVVAGSWTRPLAMNQGVTVRVGTRMSYAGAYITVLDAGIYAWEVTCAWGAISAQTSPPDRSVGVEINDVSTRFGQRTDVDPADDYIGSLRQTYHGTISLHANDKVRAAFYQYNPATASRTVVPEAFTVYRIA